MDTRREVEHFRLYSFVLAAGLVDMILESLNFLNASNTEKQMQLYLKMASRLGQHLLRTKYKTENFGLFALYSSYFFLSAAWLLHGQLLAVIEQIVSLTHSITQC